MCGIFGCFRFEDGKDYSRKAVEILGDCLNHRGPDGEGIFFGEGVALGNKRLAIIDVEHGQQPQVSASGDVVVVQNGEIYNYIELIEELKSTGNHCETHSDTEAILRLYERDGIEFVHRLNGMFAIAIYDRRIDEMFLIRDRVGVKPLYVCEHEGCVWFASEFRGFFDIDIPKKVSEVALDAFLALNYVPPPMTMFEGVHHVGPGTIFRVNRKGSSVHTWWDLAAVKQNEDIGLQEASDEVLRILSDATSLRMRADVECGAFLSGGIDSSAVVGLMRKQTSDTIRTYSIGFDDPKYDESKYAAMAADRFGTRHKAETFGPSDVEALWPLAAEHCDQPHGDISFLPTYKVSQLASHDLKVVLTGDGGDEMFAGYEKYFCLEELAQDASTDELIEHFLPSLTLLNTDQRKALRGGDNAFDTTAFLREKLAPVDHWDPVNKALYIDTTLLLPGNNLVKPDRMGMASSIEARTPFLDYRMVEFAFSLPGPMKLTGGTTKWILKNAVEELIGSELTHRKKAMFTVPIGDWLCGPLKSTYANLTPEGHPVFGEYFDGEAVGSLIDLHLTGAENRTREVRALMALALH